MLGSVDKDSKESKMADLNVPPPMLFPIPQNERETEFYRALDEHLNRIRQTLLEIIEELP
jgi:hypothetical protein